MTWVGILNFIVLQWFGVRLARVYRTEQYDLRPDHVSLMSDGSFATAWSAKTRLVRAGWRLLRWAWPLTGWWGPYRWIRRTDNAPR